MPDKLIGAQVYIRHIVRAAKIMLGYVKRQYLGIFIGLLAGIAVYLLWLLLRLALRWEAAGAEGGQRADVWSFFIAVLSFIPAILAVAVPLWIHRRQQTEQASSGASHGKAVPRTTRIAWHGFLTGTVIASLTVLLSLVSSAWVFRHWQTEPITHSIKLTDNALMRHDSKAYATLPATSHQKLNIKIKLESQTTTGSCVAPARLTITPTHNGNNGRPLYDASSDIWQTLELGNVRDGTTLEFTLNLAEEPFCSVKLNVAEAYYYQ